MNTQEVVMMAALIKAIPAVMEYAMMKEQIVGVEVEYTNTYTRVPYIKRISFPNGALTRTERMHDAEGIRRHGYVLTCNADVLAVFQLPMNCA
jgi:hypothetical protein